MTDYAFFLQGSDRWGKDLTLLWGHLNICPSLQQFHISSVIQLELSSLTSLKAWGDKEKFHNNIAFLLVSAEEEATGDRKCGLSTIWVNPCQARVCSMEEACRELTTWVSSGPNWTYTLVQLNKDTHHVPLPKEGHLGILPQGGTNSTACGRISQLEVCQLLISGLQVAYPIGLNGHEDPIITSLPESLANGISLTGGRSIYLKVDILQPMVEEPDWKMLPLGGCSAILIASPSRPPPKTGKRGQYDHGGKKSPVLDDVRHIWSCVWELNPKKTKPCCCTHTSTPQAEGSLQVSGHLIPGECPRWCQDGRRPL